MKIVPTRVHGVIDYLYAGFFLAAPDILDFADVSPANIVARAFGTLFLVQAVMTRYELGIMKLIPMKMHLLLDYVFGPLLIASPWLFGFTEPTTNIWLPFVGAGLLGLAATYMTELEPRYALPKVNV